MEKFKSLLLMTAYTLVFLGCEYLIHSTQNLVSLGIVASVTLWIIGLISAFAAIAEAIEIGFDIEIKSKLRGFFDKI